MKVLFIDDEPALLEQAEIFLERENEEFDVDTTITASEGLEMLENSEYDVVVSDYMLGDMGGKELLEKLREKGDDFLLIVYTGRDMDEIKDVAKESGADLWIQKGGDPIEQYRNLAETITEEVDKKNSG